MKTQTDIIDKIADLEDMVCEIDEDMSEECNIAISALRWVLGEEDDIHLRVHDKYRL